MKDEYRLRLKARDFEWIKKCTESSKNEKEKQKMSKINDNHQQIQESADEQKLAQKEELLHQLITQKGKLQAQRMLLEAPPLDQGLEAIMLHGERTAIQTGTLLTQLELIDKAIIETTNIIEQIKQKISADAQQRLKSEALAEILAQGRICADLNEQLNVALSKLGEIFHRNEGSVRTFNSSKPLQIKSDAKGLSIQILEGAVTISAGRGVFSKTLVKYLSAEELEAAKKPETLTAEKKQETLDDYDEVEFLQREIRSA